MRVVSPLKDWTEMRFGLFSNDRRPVRSLGDSWRLDGDEIVLADKCGMDEAWVSEHQASADILIARAAGLTTNIRLGSAVRLVPLHHPVQVAQDAAVCDQLSGGRYMLGVGRGFLVDKLKIRGLDSTRAAEQATNGLDVLLQILAAKEPFDLDGPFWYGKDIAIGIDWVNGPPEVCQAVSGNPESGHSAGLRGVGLLTGDYAQPTKLRSITAAYVEGQQESGRTPTRSGIRVSRVIYVADTDKQARDDMRASYEAVIKYEIGGWPWHMTDRIPANGTLQDITFDGLVDSGNLMVGSPETVRQMVEQFYGEVGGFGALLFHGGRDYATPEKLGLSMTMFMEQVVPKLTHLNVD